MARNSPETVRPARAARLELQAQRVLVLQERRGRLEQLVLWVQAGVRLARRVRQGLLEQQGRSALPDQARRVRQVHRERLVCRGPPGRQGLWGLLARAPPERQACPEPWGPPARLALQVRQAPRGPQGQQGRVVRLVRRAQGEPRVLLVHLVRQARALRARRARLEPPELVLLEPPGLLAPPARRARLEPQV